MNKHRVSRTDITIGCIGFGAILFSEIPELQRACLALMTASVATILISITWDLFVQ